MKDNRNHAIDHVANLSIENARILAQVVGTTAGLSIVDGVTYEINQVLTPDNGILGPLDYKAVY